MSSSRLSPHSSNTGKQDQAEQSPACTYTEAEKGTFQAEKRIFPFTQSQLSLALSIQRSKPAAITTREFCVQIQKHIKQGKPTAEGKHLYIDSAEFWREQCSRLHSERKVMEVRLANLEALTDHRGVAVVSESPSPIIPANDGSDLLLNELRSTSNLPLLNQALALHRLLLDDKVSTDVLISAIQLPLSFMNFAVSEACKVTRAGWGSSLGGANYISLRTFNIVTAIFNICLKGLGHLCRDIPGRRCRGQVVYSLVRFFSAALGHVHALCVQQAAHQSPDTGNYQNTALDKADYGDTTKPLSLISELAKFLVNLLTCPEFQKAHPSHIEVLEGMYSVLLHEVGGLLSQVTFGDQLSTSRRLGRITCIDRSTPAPVDGVAVDLKGQHLAFVLQHTMGRDGLEKNKLSLATMLAGTKFSVGNAGKHLLLTRAKQRLQETLVKGIFGDAGEQFVGALQMPKSGEGWDAETPRVVGDKKDSFVETVWSTVGWDMVLNT